MQHVCRGDQRYGGVRMKFPSILFLLLTFFGRNSRVVFDEPSSILSTNSPEIVMAQPAKEGTYRFGVSIETTPGKGCQEDTVLYFVRSYVNTKGLSAGLRTEAKIGRMTVTNTAEIPASVFRVHAGSRISYHVEYMIGGQCKTRPTYKVFPLLERVGK